MLNLTKDTNLEEPFYINEPFPILVYDNFLSKKECDELIQEASNIAKKDNYEVMGGRFVIPWRSTIFKGLISKSRIWKSIKEKMPEEAFRIFNKISENNTKKETYFKKWKNRKRFYFVEDIYSLSKYILSKKLYKSYRKRLDMPSRMIPNNALILYGLLGILDNIYRKLRSIYDLIIGKVPLIPLFEYNASFKGYAREVHRDTDSRVFVCILYLNELRDDNISNSGGSLEIYEKIKNKDFYAPQPINNDVKKIINIEPKPGRFVFFFNQSNSYHAVNKMSFFKKGRHFIYGGFSLQSSLGSAAKFKSKGNLPTNYLIYR